MDNETFEITIAKVGEPVKKYKMQVEIILRSEQTIRFRICAGDKSMIMEKLLLKHKGQWKIREANFQITGDPKTVAQAILTIQNEIEFYLAGRPKPVNKFKDKQ